MLKKNTPQSDFEVLVIGGGPAGLSAALYLARFDRQVALFDSGRGRSTWHQTARNYLGFPGGIRARRLRDLGHRQLADYPQVKIFECGIDVLELDRTSFTARGEDGESWTGQAAILCTGVFDNWPKFKKWEAYVGRSMFWCITCDGYNAKGRRVVVVGNNDAAVSETLQLQRFTDQLILLTNNSDCKIAPRYLDRLRRAHIPVIVDRIERVEGSRGQFHLLFTAGGHCIELDQLFSQQGITPRTDLARGLGVALSDDGYIRVDVEQRTSVPFVYAAGDVTKLHSHQISTAVHEGGQAACSANYDLYPPDLKDD